MANKHLKNIFYILVIFILILSNSLYAKVCPFCHATGISSLAMVCPECGHSLFDRKSMKLYRKTSSLTIRLLYTGKKVSSLPPYGKLYINNKYMGNINLIESEVETKRFQQSWSSGLGKNFSAYYEKRLRNIPVGILKIKVKMKFKRLYGFGRSYKEVIFPYVSFKANKDTVISHYFNSAVTFHKYKPGKRAKLPIISDMKIQGAKGNLAVNVPLFK